ncbi:GNAT family N-acetyltransferase [Lysinibacillus sp. ZYM-1]|uniref:GNAT family N-acetyltransferase n=1 Tax=Lysinibacillus sp. ZYM-1 TaxID=1681184 RepID=UPI0006CE7B36|nr:GNAT family N-acetyltransferase [Lysinibacillus sp. ZYM-1]KPN96729.1 GCN5 family acetyltransferase [Lysinibacillus sp. ZYM-1]
MDKQIIDIQMVHLRSITIEDFPFVLKWSKDQKFCLANGWGIKRSPEELFQWWLNCVRNASGEFIRMGIEYNGVLLGYADLSNMKQHTAELGVAIGDSSYWGKGIGTHAARCMLTFACENFNLKQLLAETHETNVRARFMLEKIGFIEMSRIGNEEYLGNNCKLIQYSLQL